MEIYITLCDSAGGGKSGVIGAFTTEEKARTAAQEDNESELHWHEGNTAAEAEDGDVYDIVLVELDVAT